MLIVFDLDFTLWNAGGEWCDCTTPPYSIVKGKIYDAENRHIHLYPDALEILQTLKSNNIKTAIASRTSSPEIANELLEKLNIADLFDYIEIYPSDKKYHFTSLFKKAKIPYHKIYFFNIQFVIKNI